MIVIGLDISSTSTGWTILKHGRFYKREGIDYGWIKPPKKYSLSQKLTYFRSELVEVLESTDRMVDYVGVEDVFYSRNVSTLKLLSKFSGVACEAIMATLGLDPTIVEVRTIRSVTGTQDKKETYSFITSKYKLDKWSYSAYNDITDALAVALYIHTTFRRM